MKRRIDPVDLATISLEWDKTGPKRQMAIDAGLDLSLMYITAPCILKSISMIPHKKILDAGCGTGFLTNEMAEISEECWGIDSSRECIRFAKERYQKKTLNFVCTPIKSFAYNHLFDVCVSNMVFMDDPEWKDSLIHIVEMLAPKGRLLMTITHPCFWPKYWGYQDEPWFNYSEEIFIQGDFSITMEKQIGITTHIHRPLSSYLSTLIQTGLKIEKIAELTSEKAMPSTDERKYPRFIFIQAIK